MARGPAYPYIDLGGAIALLEKFYAYTKRSAAVIDSVVKDAWGWSPTSSTGAKAIAALKYFGLIEDAPGSGKQVKVSERGLRVLHHPVDSDERRQALQEAVLLPGQYSYCWKQWGKDLPPSAKSKLILERGFVDTTVDGFLSDYRKSLTYAGMMDDLQNNKSNIKNGEDKSTPSFKVGDYVQWESQGILQFKEPRRVVSLSDDGEYATAEGSLTGIPVKELSLAEKPADSLFFKQVENDVFGAIGTKKLPEANGVRQEVFSMSEGSVKIEWPAVISQESFQDFKDWLIILERKIKRSVNPPFPPEKAKNGDQKDP